MFGHKYKMSTEEERLVVLEKVVSSLIDRIEEFKLQVEELKGRVSELEELKGRVSELEENGATGMKKQKFSMDGPSSVSLFEKMFPGSTTSKNPNVANITNFVGVGGTEYDPSMDAQNKEPEPPTATSTRRARIISRQ